MNKGLHTRLDIVVFVLIDGLPVCVGLVVRGEAGGLFLLCILI